MSAPHRCSSAYGALQNMFMIWYNMIASHYLEQQLASVNESKWWLKRALAPRQFHEMHQLASAINSNVVSIAKLCVSPTYDVSVSCAVRVIVNSVHALRPVHTGNM